MEHAFLEQVYVHCWFVGGIAGGGEDYGWEGISVMVLKIQLITVIYFSSTWLIYQYISRVAPQNAPRVYGRGLRPLACLSVRVSVPR